jgi:hypothetical protein
MLVRIAQSQKLVHNDALDRFEHRSDSSDRRYQELLEKITTEKGN